MPLMLVINNLIINCYQKKICLKEKTNFLNLNSTDFEHKIDFIACDVSFISLTKIIEQINKIFAYPFKLVCLIKPEFELTPKIIAKNKGHVDLKYHKKVIEKILSLAKKINFKIYEPIKSPIVSAKKGNIEYLILLEKNQDLNKYFLFFRLWKNKIYLFFRNQKIEKYKYIFIPLNKIESIELPTNQKMEIIQELINTRLNNIIKYDYHTNLNQLINEQLLLKQNWQQMIILENELINQI